MPWRLKVRDASLQELMDREDCDEQHLQRTYAQFRVINHFLSGWHALYVTLLKPHLTSHDARVLLDVGCGGGDVARQFARWAERDGLNLHVVGIDPDARAIRFARTHHHAPRVQFEQASTTDLLASGRTFDFVTSNHLLHHLSDETLTQVLLETQRLARVTAVHNDLARSPLAYALFAMFARPVFRGSFIVPDGLTSIRRSFTSLELRRLAPPGWDVRSTAPFRNVLVYERR